MHRNKIIAVTLIATSLIATTPAFASNFTNNNHNGCGLEEVNSGKKFAYFVINGKVIGHASPVIRGGVTFVSAPDILDELGIEYTTNKSGGNSLTVNVDGHEYVFWSRTGMNNYYTKDGEKIYIKVQEQNGVKVPENVAQNVYTRGKMFVPLSFFTKELGYSDAFSVDDSYCLNMGTGANFGGVTARQDDFITGEKKNCNKTIAEGWVCPQIKSISKDNLVDDAKTLINELEFSANGNISAMFNPEGFQGISVGPYATGENASHFTNIKVVDYGADSNESEQKINQVLPQVLKFYYPNSWQKVDEILKQKGGTVRYTIDGRDTIIEAGSGNIFMSRVNGSLQGHLADCTVSGTIGTAYDVQTSYTGYWTKYGTQYWHYADSNNQLVKGWKQIDGKWYYFDENGRMVTDTVVSGYKIGSDGVWVQ